MNTKIATFRARLGMTQEALAQKSGISRRALSSIETGTSVPAVDVALRIAGVLNATVEVLFGDDAETDVAPPPAPFASTAVPSGTRWSDFRFIDLFAGIGGIRLAFESVGGRCVFSSEFDEQTCRTYEANFGEHPSGDITKIAASEIPDFDILLAGFPCQAFSIIGKKEGFANETCGTLFFEIERILQDKRPPAFLLENVRNLTAHDGGKTFRVIREHLTALGYHVHAKILNALDFGVPQKRERIVIVGFQDDVPFDFPEAIPDGEKKTLADILESNVDPKYYVRPAIRDARLAKLKDPEYPKPYVSHENMAGSITPRPYSAALRSGASANYILIDDERRPTEREMLRLQGFPDSFKIVVNYSQMKKQCGNSVAVPVMKAVARQMLHALREYETNPGEKKERDAKERRVPEDQPYATLFPMECSSTDCDQERDN